MRPGLNTEAPLLRFLTAGCHLVKRVFGPAPIVNAHTRYRDTIINSRSS